MGLSMRKDMTEFIGEWSSFLDNILGGKGTFTRHRSGSYKFWIEKLTEQQDVLFKYFCPLKVGDFIQVKQSYVNTFTPNHGYYSVVDSKTIYTVVDVDCKDGGDKPLFMVYARDDKEFECGKWIEDPMRRHHFHFYTDDVVEVPF